jgi:hypothetical protein
MEIHGKCAWIDWFVVLGLLVNPDNELCFTLLSVTESNDIFGAKSAEDICNHSKLIFKLLLENIEFRPVTTEVLHILNKLICLDESLKNKNRLDSFSITYQQSHTNPPMNGLP